MIEDLMLHEEWCGCGAGAASALLYDNFRVDIDKALDPLDRNDYMTIVGRLSRSLSRATESTEKEILTKAMQNLDIDWRNISPAARNQAIAAAREAMRPIPEQILPTVQQEIEVRGDRTMRGTKRSAKKAIPARFSSQIQTSLSLRDEKIKQHLVRSQATFVTDEYGRRRQEFSRRAQHIVANGLEEGLGRADITDKLNKDMSTVVGIRRSRNYWEVISSVFMNRARTYAHLSSMSEAAVEVFIFEAVMDERTTDQCAYMHGREFTVRNAINRFQRSEAAPDPEAVKDIQPWIRKGKDIDGNLVLFSQDRTGTRTHLADVVESRVGVKGKQGVFRSSRSSNQLQGLGIATPPLHGRCRSTIVANV